MYSSTTITDLHTSSGCKKGSCASFDGVDDYVEIGDKPSLNFGTQNFTVVFLVKIPADTSSGRAISKMALTGTGDPNQQAGWYVSAVSSTDNSGLYWGMGDGTNIWTKLTYPYPFSSEKWYLISGVFDRTNGYFYGYVNNVLIGQTVISQYGSVNNNRRFLIGKRDVSSASWFFGFLDEVRIYNRALSDSEIQAIYNATK